MIDSEVPRKFPSDRNKDNLSGETIRFWTLTTALLKWKRDCGSRAQEQC